MPFDSPGPPRRFVLVTTMSLFKTSKTDLFLARQRKAPSGVWVSDASLRNSATNGGIDVAEMCQLTGWSRNRLLGPFLLSPPPGHRCTTHIWMDWTRGPARRTHRTVCIARKPLRMRCWPLEFRCTAALGPDHIRRLPQSSTDSASLAPRRATIYLTWSAPAPIVMDRVKIYRSG
ncbi:hypothetical protein C8R47DRAFT_1146728 [Mycena vitilis]|nr:hypothetical protein C8R47DRAFT_1146728 [Mycena vitilis]